MEACRRVTAPGVREFIAVHHHALKPFVWTTTVDQILARATIVKLF
jgi:hypothetical protein